MYIDERYCAYRRKSKMSSLIYIEYCLYENSKMSRVVCVDVYIDGWCCPYKRKSKLISVVH